MCYPILQLFEHVCIKTDQRSENKSFVMFCNIPCIPKLATKSVIDANLLNDWNLTAHHQKKRSIPNQEVFQQDNLLQFDILTVWCMKVKTLLQRKKYSTPQQQQKQQHVKCNV